MRTVITVPAGIVTWTGCGGGGGGGVDAASGADDVFSLSLGALSSVWDAVPSVDSADGCSRLREEWLVLFALGRGAAGSSDLSGAVTRGASCTGGASATVGDDTSIWLSTFFTPLDWLARRSTAAFSRSVWTLPLSATTPWLEETRMSRVFRTES